MDDLKYTIRLLEELRTRILRIEILLESQQNATSGTFQHTVSDNIKQKNPARKVNENNSHKIKNWYKRGTTIDKIMSLISDGFFNENKAVKDIIIKLESKDFHFKPKDLTLPLRKIVRHGLLEKTKNLHGDVKSKKWTYIKI